MYADCSDIWMIFYCIRTFSFRYNDNLISIVLESQDIVQVVQTIQNGRTEVWLHWTLLKCGKPTQNNIPNVCNLQKEYNVL